MVAVVEVVAEAVVVDDVFGIHLPVLRSTSALGTKLAQAVHEH